MIFLFYFLNFKNIIEVKAGLDQRLINLNIDSDSGKEMNTVNRIDLTQSLSANKQTRLSFKRKINNGKYSYAPLNRSFKSKAKPSNINQTKNISVSFLNLRKSTPNNRTLYSKATQTSFYNPKIKKNVKKNKILLKYKNKSIFQQNFLHFIQKSPNDENFNIYVPEEHPTNIDSLHISLNSLNIEDQEIYPFQKLTFTDDPFSLQVNDLNKKKRENKKIQNEDNINEYQNSIYELNIKKEENNDRKENSNMEGIRTKQKEKYINGLEYNEIINENNNTLTNTKEYSDSLENSLCLYNNCSSNSKSTKKTFNQNLEVKEEKIDCDEVLISIEKLMNEMSNVNLRYKREKVIKVSKKEFNNLNNILNLTMKTIKNINEKNQKGINKDKNEKKEQQNGNENTKNRNKKYIDNKISITSPNDIQNIVKEKKPDTISKVFDLLYDHGKYKFVSFRDNNFGILLLKEIIKYKILQSNLKYHENLFHNIIKLKRSIDNLLLKFDSFFTKFSLQKIYEIKYQQMMTDYKKLKKIKEYIIKFKETKENEIAKTCTRKDLIQKKGEKRLSKCENLYKLLFSVSLIGDF